MANRELVALNVQIPKLQKEGIDRLAAEEYTSSATIVRRALRLFLDLDRRRRGGVPARRRQSVRRR